MLTDQKRWFSYGLVLIVLLSGLIFASFLSYREYGVRNPMASLIGLFQVVYTDQPIVPIQESPKVILVKHDVSLEEYMAERGFTMKEQIGSYLIFAHDEKEEEQIKASGTWRSSKWVWQ